MSRRHEPGTMRVTRAPFRSIGPRSLSRVLLTCEHAAPDLPFRARRTPDIRRVLASHWGFDIGAWELTREIARRLKAGAIGGRWSRLAIDLNRRIDDPTLIRPSADGVALPWNERLDADEVERRVLSYHTPYHVEIDRLILRRMVRGVRPLVVAMHSFTPALEGRQRPFEIGVLYRDHAAPARRLGKLLREAGLSVRYNQPYSGIAGMMYAVDRHGTHHGLPCLEIEINQAMFARRGAAARLAGVLAPALERLGEGN